MANVRQPSETFYRFVGPKYRCAYCGEPSDTIDHTTPRWFVLENHELLRRYWLYKVSSCSSCNQFAGAVVDRTFRSRKLRIARKLARRAKKLLQTADWPADELAELGYCLRSLCEQAHKDATVVRRRLRFLTDPFWPHDVPLELQVRLPAVSDGETVNGKPDLPQLTQEHDADRGRLAVVLEDYAGKSPEDAISRGAGRAWRP